MIVNAKIKRSVTAGEYPDESFKVLFDEAKVEFVKLDLPKLEIYLLL